MENRVAAYLRLSGEDYEKDDSSLSTSIASQKEIITEFILNNNWNLIDYYIDDGYSGTSFNRPAFNRLLNDIENKRIDIVITKDLSRLGRNYIQAGYFTENYFPLHNVRFIAISDSYDTLNPDNEFAPFKNIINEWYSRDISRKIRFSKHARQKRGESTITTSPLYGYRYDKEGNRIIDPVTSAIVILIYQKYLEFKSINKVIKYLETEKIITPGFYLYKTQNYDKKKYENLPDAKKYEWNMNCICKILKSKEYLGYYITHKKERVSYKNRHEVKTNNPYIFENKYEAIVPTSLYNEVQALLTKNRALLVTTKENIFQDIIHCASCLRSLCHNRYNGSIIMFCHHKECLNRVQITLSYANKLVLKDLNNLKEIILANEEKFIEFTKVFLEKKHNIPHFTKEEDIKERINEIKLFLEKSFEAKTKGELPYEVYKTMYKEYHSELILLSSKVNAEVVTVPLVDYTKDARRVIEILKRYPDEDKLSYEFVHSIIEDIKVERIKPQSSTGKVLHITYKYLDDAIKEYLKNV